MSTPRDHSLAVWLAVFAGSLLLHFGAFAVGGPAFRSMRAGPGAFDDAAPVLPERRQPVVPTAKPLPSPLESPRRDPVIPWTPLRPLDRPPAFRPEPAKKTSLPDPLLANAGFPDLVPLAIQAPAPLAVDIRQNVTVQVKNQGQGSVSVERIDRLWFSRHATLDHDAILMSETRVPAGLEAGSSQWVRAAALLPEDTPVGLAWLIVEVNANRAVEETGRSDNNVLAVQVMVDPKSNPLGDPDSQARPTVAWISSDDFRQLKARHSRTLQPALQEKVNPTVAKQTPYNPGIPNPSPDKRAGGPDSAIKQSASSSGTAPVLSGVASLPAAQTAATPTPPASVQRHVAPAPAPQPVFKPDAPPDLDPQPHDVPDLEPLPPKAPDSTPPAPAPSTLPGPATVPPPPVPMPRPAPPPPLPAPQPAPPPVPQPRQPVPGAVPAPLAAPAQPRPSSPPSTSQAGDPAKASPVAPFKSTASTAVPSGGSAPSVAGDGATNAPRDAAAVTPTQLDEDDLQRSPGGVLVGRGTKITVARLHPPGVGTQIAATPRDPRVEVEFDAKGNAVRAVLLSATGNPDWDAAVLESLYNWKASGPEVTAGGLIVRWRILFNE